MDPKQKIEQLVEQKKDKFIALSRTIWEFAELGYEEYKSSETLCKALEEEGFAVTKKLAGIPTAFKGVWGSGNPVIGILGEYDALPGLSQKAGCPVKTPLHENGAGHGCGHNLLGAGAMAGAVALKEYLESTKQAGTIIYFGTPAEENLSGKAFMARDGVFDGVDFFYTWHPSSFNRIGAVHMNANISRIYEFKGITAHAGGAPHLGRSALDSCELMGVGANYLREHIIMEARIHYAYLDVGGRAPNVVQDHAAVRYVIRAPYLRQVKDIIKRVDQIAEGAALMSGTTVTYHTESGYSEYIPNNVLAETADKALHEIGGPLWDEQDFALAKDFTEAFNDQSKEKERETIIQRYGRDKLAEKLQNPLDTQIEKYDKNHIIMEFGSTDAGDVGYIAPTVHLNIATEALETPGHSWLKAGQANSSIGLKGMVTAAKVIALSCVKMIEDPDKIKQAKAEFMQKNNGIYDCPVAGVTELPKL